MTSYIRQQSDANIDNAILTHLIQNTEARLSCQPESARDQNPSRQSILVGATQCSIFASPAPHFINGAPCETSDFQETEVGVPQDHSQQVCRRARRIYRRLGRRWWLKHCAKLSWASRNELGMVVSKFEELRRQRVSVSIERSPDMNCANESVHWVPKALFHKTVGIRQQYAAGSS